MNSGPIGFLTWTARMRVDLTHRVCIERPTHRVVDRIELLGLARAPQALWSGPDRGSSARPERARSCRSARCANTIERSHGSQVLAEARLAEFRIDLAQVIALEACVLVASFRTTDRGRARRRPASRCRCAAQYGQHVASRCRARTGCRAAAPRGVGATRRNAIHLSTVKLLTPIARILPCSSRASSAAAVSSIGTRGSGQCTW